VELEIKLKAANTDIENLRTDLSNIMLSDAAKKNELTSQKCRINTITQTFADEQNKSTGLKLRVQTLKQEYDVLNAQYKQQEDKNAALYIGYEARIKMLRAENNFLMAENGDLQHELSKSQEVASSEPHTTQSATNNEPVESDQRASGPSNERVGVMTEQKVTDERDAVAAIERQIEVTRQEVARVQADRHAVQQKLHESREESQSSSDASSVGHLNNSFGLLMTHDDTDIGRSRSVGSSSAAGQVADGEEQRPQSPRTDRVCSHSLSACHDADPKHSGDSAAIYGYDPNRLLHMPISPPLQLHDLRPPVCFAPRRLQILRLSMGGTLGVLRQSLHRLASNILPTDERRSPSTSTADVRQTLIMAPTLEFACISNLGIVSISATSLDETGELIGSL
jgi:hypothetical protein